jgi:hypothetical protein
MSFTKSSSSCKNLSFIWLLDCYQISNLPPLLYAKNCCTIADKIHSTTEAPLIQFSWNLYSILYHKSRACVPNFKSIQTDLVTQTWLSSQLAQFLNIGQVWTTWAILHQIWINLETNLFEYFHKTYIHSIHLLNVIFWTYPTLVSSWSSKSKLQLNYLQAIIWFPITTTW